MKTVVVQFADSRHPQYTCLLGATRDLHAAHCRKNGYDYIASTQACTDRHPYWEKCNLLRGAAASGYEHIVWLDADTVWYGEPLILPPTVFGLTWHKPMHEPAHWNAGVMYVNNTGSQAIEPLEAWWCTPEDGHKWCDQWSLNKMLTFHPGLVTRLEHRWNSVEYLEGHFEDGAIVSAWHGLGAACLSAMLHAIEKRGLS